MHYVQVSVGGASWQRRCFRGIGSELCASHGFGPRPVRYLGTVILWMFILRELRRRVGGFHVRVGERCVLLRRVR